MILTHFENKEVPEVGGTENCCDNCDQRKRIISSKGGNTETSPSLMDEQNFGKEARDILNAIQVCTELAGVLNTELIFYMHFMVYYLADRLLVENLAWHCQ